MVMIHNIGHSIAYHIDATGEEQDAKPGSLEGIWWLPNETATDYLLLTNLGSAPLRVDLFLRFHRARGQAEDCARRQNY
jgi:hypothetical protein